jgi:sensor histidine kinase YesM
MQQSLIALLRATMPNLREGKAQLRRTLGEELAVIHPYLDILKTRMEERLQTNLQVPPGLLSAEFPPMMLQSLVENAIKHGLEPKPQGGEITIEALVADGRLLVNVCDTGVGFGASPPTAANPTIAPLGSGLENIRERLKHLYGTEATLTIARNEPEGTAVRISLPYRVVSA